MSEKQSTPAEEAGFLIEKLYECIDDEDSSYYVKGNIYRFEEDDGSEMPWFVPYKEYKLPKSDIENIAIPLENLKPYNPENTAIRHKWADEIRGELLSEGLYESASAVTEIIKEQSKFIKYKGVN